MKMEMIVRTRPRVVILGGGFAGAYCARELQRLVGERAADILLLDEHNFFVFYPLLVDAGVGSLEPRHAIVPIREFLSLRTRFRMGRAVRVDPESQRVHYIMTGEQQERVIEYDHLVIALGSVGNIPPVPGLREYGWQVKSLADSIALRDRAIQLLELANVAQSEEAKRRLLHLVVVGGNYTGVEVAGQFEEFLREGARHYRNVRPEDVRTTLVEYGPRLLPAMRARLSRFAERKLREGGVDLRLNETLVEIGEDYAVLKSGERLDAATCVWCAGIRQNPAVATMEFRKDERGYLDCEPDGRVKGCANVWAIGDTASNPRPGGGFYPPTAQAATRLGVQCARNIARAFDGRKPKPIRFRDLGSLCAIGNRRAVAEVMGVPFSGFIAWWLYRTVYLLKMPGASRKVRVVMDWTLELFFRRDYTQLGLHRGGIEHPLPPAEREKEREAERKKETAKG